MNNTTETFNKVAAITLLFWIMKIIATMLGETLGGASHFVVYLL
jgi:uncharacterized membrane-anchored protein